VCEAPVEGRVTGWQGYRPLRVSGLGDPFSQHGWRGRFRQPAQRGLDRCVALSLPRHGMFPQRFDIALEPFQV
jgi:hypothetical protein